MDILKTIIDETRERVRSDQRTKTVESLELLPAFRAPTLSLTNAVEKAPIGIIAELKKASPSQGTIQPDFDVSKIACSYRSAGAAAISILTEPNHFKGSIDHLASVRMVVDLPILRKDFVIDPYQIVEARAWGADAVLLIAAALESRQLAELQSAAAELDMECLVEVHEISELDKIDLDRTRLLGINNRNLKTLEVDIRTTKLIADLVPTGTTIVSESGLQSGDEVADLIRRGIDGFLVGTSLMKRHDPGEALSRLLSQTQKSLRSPQKLRRVAV
jgi:indole-3-glycerol phosphate synthase